MLNALTQAAETSPSRRRRRKSSTKTAANNNYARPSKTGARVKGEIVGVKKSKSRRMAFMPARVETRTAVNGKAYIFARGEIVYRRKSFTYTVMVPFWRHAQFAEAMASGHALEIEGSRQVLRIAKGRKTVDGGAYIQADRLLGVLDGTHATKGSAEPSRTLPGHERKGFYRRQHYGPNNSLTKVIWIDKVDVNGGLKAA